MHKEKLLEIAREILSQPTAPFHEARVREAISSLLRPCAHVRLRQDDFGNLIAHYRGAGVGAGEPAGPRYAFCAHMDHPGWVRPDDAEALSNPGRHGTEQTDPVRAAVGGMLFFGGVPAELAAANRERVCEFDHFAMWDLPAYDFRNDRIYSRAIDDLMGCVTIVATLLELEASGAACECYGLFTRAEEVGFVGAIAMARESWLRDQRLTVISLETSSERPPAKMGGGPIIRVGDRTSIFEAAVTAELVQAAEVAEVPFQRCLMSGGTCEATAFQLFGVRCGAMCVALGNYHNIGPEGKTIEPEFVSQADVEGLVALCINLARRNEQLATLPDPATALLGRIEERISQYKPYHHRDRLSPAPAPAATP